VDLDVVPVDLRRFAADLEAGDLDVVLNVGIPDAPGLRTRRIWQERFVCVLRQGHPAAGALDLAAFAALDHVLVSPQGGGGPGVVDTALAAHGLERRVAVRLRSFLAATLLVARTDLVMTVSSHLAAEVGPGMGLQVLPPPVELAGFGVRMAWHERFDADPGQAWLRAELAAVGAALGA
jgi:DNA-binding transcriptional LysR family regulator